MISGLFTKIAIALELRVVHTYLIYEKKSPYFSLSNDITYMSIRFISKEKRILNLFFHFYFLIQDFSLNIAWILSIFNNHFDNIHSEGTLSQNFVIDLSFIFMSKNGKIFCHSCIIIFLHFIK